jgi:hypothetical protein
MKPNYEMIVIIVIGYIIIIIIKKFIIIGNYYRNLNEYLKPITDLTFTVGSLRTDTLQSYVSTVDN